MKIVDLRQRREEGNIQKGGAISNLQVCFLEHLRRLTQEILSPHRARRAEIAKRFRKRHPDKMYVLRTRFVRHHDSVETNVEQSTAKNKGSAMHSEEVANSNRNKHSSSSNLLTMISGSIIKSSTCSSKASLPQANASQISQRKPNLHDLVLGV